MKVDENTNLPMIMIILVNYNNYEYTLKCVESLRENDYPNYCVTIVDNKSTNNSMGILKTIEDDSVHVIESETNGGFAKGNNLGIRFAIERGADYCLLLNNDTLVKSDFLSRMVEAVNAEENDCAATCRIMYYPESELIWYAGGKIDWKNSRAVHEGIRMKYEIQEEKQRYVGFASGCCILISRNTIMSVGGLPEDYFMYYEDLDYCYQLEKNRIPIVYVPESVVYHCVSSASGGEDSEFCIEWQNRARRILMKKYGRERLSLVERVSVNAKCELRALVKILLSKKRIGKLKAYINSFRKGNREKG